MINRALRFRFSTRGGNRTRTLLPELDFESSASTNSATRAGIYEFLLPLFFKGVQIYGIFLCCARIFSCL